MLLIFSKTLYKKVYLISFVYFLFHFLVFSSHTLFAASSYFLNFVHLISITSMCIYRHFSWDAFFGNFHVFRGSEFISWLFFQLFWHAVLVKMYLFAYNLTFIIVDYENCNALIVANLLQYASIHIPYIYTHHSIR